MMYVDHKTPDGLHNRIIRVYVGANIAHLAPLVNSVQADGDELEAIYARGLYPHQPITKTGKGYQRVVEFYGDTAKFIVGNW